MVASITASATPHFFKEADRIIYVLVDSQNAIWDELCVLFIA